ncbi:unnamed protein product, partial [Prorocentrum cordatum]
EIPDFPPRRQATFGPTRGSLEELSQTTLQSWVRTQLQAPAESHREYYRKRVSSRRTLSPLVGSPRSLCAQGSRWHSFAFSAADVGKPISITGNKIYVDGEHRSDIDPTYSGNGLAPPATCTDNAPPWMVNDKGSCSAYEMQTWTWLCGGAAPGDAWALNMYCQQSCFDQGNRYGTDDCSPGWVSLQDSGYLCSVEEELGGLLTIGTSSCGSTRYFLNPAIWFSGSPGDPDVSLTFHEVRPGVITLAQRHGEAGASCDLGRFVHHGGQYYLSDPRLELLQNDLASPSGGDQNTCRAVPRTFLNEGSCQLRAACGALAVGGTSPPAAFVLNAATFQLFHESSAQRYVYEVTGLVDVASPCGRRSRWRLLDCTSEACSESVGSATEAAAVAAALSREAGSLRDVYVSCESVAAGAVVRVGASYFMHVHSNEHNVYDFTRWVSEHPGGTEPITRWATGDFRLEFPSWHPMGRWAFAQPSIEYIGRLGDTVDFETLPVALQAAWTVGYESCGSPGEVANDPSLGHHFSFYTSYTSDLNDLNFEVPFWRPSAALSRTQVWTMMALEANDQLRQRAAWALSQILVASTSGLNFHASQQSELWVNYYDIFVRNAFGNYRDVLREVTYSPVMAEYLTYRLNWALDVSGTYPDENYAREIMQLFTIGLWELNQNGTRKTDADGAAVPTYSNDDIMTFARVFTGFSEQAERPNIESFDLGGRNMVDPMMMYGVFHDVYPKPGLLGGYLGDGYPLCSDLPSGAFLREGARYKFVGYAYSGSDTPLVLDSSSPLYAALAQVQLSVVLGSTISCHAAECGMHTVSVVQVGGGYYQYVPPTCVHLYFFNGQMTAPAGHVTNSAWHQCKDPSQSVGGVACCKGCTDDPNPWLTNQGATCADLPTLNPGLIQNGCHSQSWWVTANFCQLTCWENGAGYIGDNCSDGLYQSASACGYYQEKVPLQIASARCESLGMHVCDSDTTSSECGHDDVHFHV